MRPVRMYKKFVEPQCKLLGEDLESAGTQFEHLKVLGKIKIYTMTHHDTMFDEELEKDASAFGVDRVSTNTHMTRVDEDAVYEVLRDKYDVPKPDIPEKDLEDWLNCAEALRNPCYVGRFEGMTFEEVRQYYDLNLRGAGGHLERWATMKEAVDDPEFRRQCEEMYDRLSREEPDTYFSLKPKFEKKMTEGGSLPSARPIQYGTLVWRYVGYMVFGRLFQAHLEEKAYMWSNTGSGPYESSAMIGLLVEDNGYRAVSSDVSRWDSRVRSNILQDLEPRMMERFFEPTTAAMVRNYLKAESRAPTVLPDGLVVWMNMRFSGSVITSFGNGFLNASLKLKDVSRALDVKPEELLGKGEGLTAESLNTEIARKNMLERRMLEGKSRVVGLIEGDDGVVFVKSEDVVRVVKTIEHEHAKLGFPLKSKPKECTG